jgi:hypothetical protein
MAVIARGVKQSPAGVQALLGGAGSKEKTGHDEVAG